MKISEDKFHCVLVTLVVFLVCVAPYIIVREKQLFFLDEVWTFFLSNYQVISFHDFWNSLCDNSLSSLVDESYSKLATGVCTQDEFIDAISIPKGKCVNYFNTYCLQSVDVHPPLYYFIIHTLCAVTHSQNLAFIGFVVNIVFLLFTIVILYKITYLLTRNYCLSFAVLCFYGFSYEFIDTVIYFRMYAMSACWITLLLYLHLKLVISGWIITPKIVAKICFVEILALYTHYFTSYVIISATLLTLLVLYKKNLNWKRYLKFQLATAICFLVVWPQCLFHVVKGGLRNSTYHIASVKSMILGYARLMKNSFFLEQYCLLALFVLMFVLLLVWLWRQNHVCFARRIMSNETWKYYVILVPSLFYYFCVVIFTNLITQRYVAPVMPIFSIFIVLTGWKIMQEIFKRKISANRVNIIFLAGIMCMSVWSACTKTTNRLAEYERKEEIIKTFCKGPAIVWDDEDYPLFVDVLKNYPHSKYYHTVSKYADAFFSDYLMDDSYTLYANRFCDIQSILRFFESQNYSCQELEFKTDFHKVYLLVKNAQFK